MTTLNSFTVTNEWTELTGVSDIASFFTIQNRNSKGTCLIFVGGATAPTDDKDAFILLPKKERIIDNIDNTEKIWVKSINDIKITLVINKS